MEINLQCLLYINDRVSNFYEANANLIFEIFLLLQRLLKWHIIKFNINCRGNKEEIFTDIRQIVCSTRHKFLHWQWICLNVFCLACLAQSKCKHVSPTEAGKVSHISNFHYWKHPKNIELKLKRIEKNVIFTLWYVWYLTR